MQPSLLAGMDQPALRTALSAAQQALIRLQMGEARVSLTYGQGDGNKSVTYQQTDLPQLTNLIQTLQHQLGINPKPRRVIRPRF